MNAEIRGLFERADELHARSMELADRAIILRLRGQSSECQRTREQAFELERDAADLLSGTEIPEPSRSVFHRSAASLAIEAGEWDEASRLVEQGLWGSPPRSIAAELEELRQVVHAKRRASQPLEKSVPMRRYEVERVMTYAKAFINQATDSYLRPTQA